MSPPPGPRPYRLCFPPLAASNISRARGCHLDLTAGAGLVRGSIAERERQEVELKLAVLADQLELQPLDRQTSARNRSIV